MHRWFTVKVDLDILLTVLILVLMDHAPVGVQGAWRWQLGVFVLILVLMDHAPVDDADELFVKQLKLS